MITLFPQYRIGLGVGWLLTAAAAGLMIRTAAAWYWPVLVIVLCGFLSLALAELGAVNQYRRLLLILLRDGDPKRFIRSFEPLLGQRSSPSRALTLRAYLSNAYLALGDTDRALELLAEAPKVIGKEAANARALLAGNRCSIYLQMEDAGAASEQLDILRSLRQESGINGELLSDFDVLEARCLALSGEKCDPALIKSAAEKAVSPIRRADLKLALAQLELARKHEQSAKSILQTVAGGSADLWSVRRARELLAQLV